MSGGKRKYALLPPACHTCKAARALTNAAKHTALCRTRHETPRFAFAAGIPPALPRRATTRCRCFALPLHRALAPKKPAAHGRIRLQARLATRKSYNLQIIRGMLEVENKVLRQIEKKRPKNQRKA
ncbi:hypothetical protein NPIL_209491 [Nephila pilipes]|uniref:Uncharacterized protein n=1 Tax=Nephila pilipes TaxID=299642 RepID=A0A8X6NML6_NEPPI|nr:hypothetical protein NPIL_209491 [Nephila pilipes]